MPRSSDDRSLDRLPSGRWRCRITTADGRRIAETFDTRELAAAFRDQVELDTKLRRHGLPGIIRPRPALDDLLRDWLAEHAARVQGGTLAESTYRTYHDHVASVRLWLREGLRRPALAADELDDRLIARYVASREGQRRSRKAPRPASDVQVRKDLSLLARVYSWAGVDRRWSIPRRLRRCSGGKRVLHARTSSARSMPRPRGRSSGRSPSSRSRPGCARATSTPFVATTSTSIGG